MTRSRIVALSALIALICGAAGFWFGVREGSQLGSMIEMAPRSAIAVAQLNEIQRGKTTNTTVLLESDVDDALVWSGRLEEHPLYRLLQPAWGFDIEANKRYLARVADYRKQHPSPFTPEALAKAESSDNDKREFHAWLVEGARANQAIVAKMVDRYATQIAPSK